MNIQLLVGADPELFLFNPNNDKPVSAHGLIPGSKEAPFPVVSGAVQVDGTAAEFNIDPAKTANEFAANISSVMSQLGGMVPGLVLKAVPSVYYDQDYWDSAIPEDAKELGCNPDYNAWTGGINVRPEGSATTQRTGSGHVHLGWTEGADPFGPAHYQECQEFVQILDYFLGLPSLLWDGDDSRRTLYGKAGAFRPKSYGVEYRVMSNRWVESPILQRWIFAQCQRAFECFITGVNNPVTVHGDLAQTIINNNQTNWIDLHPELLRIIPVPPMGTWEKKVA